jgi:hypothetical protein
MKRVSGFLLFHLPYMQISLNVFLSIYTLYTVTFASKLYIFFLMNERLTIKLRPYKCYPLFVMNETAPLKFWLTLTILKFI